jgi:hypothetical protein
MSTNPSIFSSDLQAQHQYVEKLRNSKFDFSLMVAEAFVRGIRDIGYKHTGTALDEFIDNSIQAGAENVHVAFHFPSNSTKPDKIAIIDDGHGMEADMIRLSIIWGGTHRENDRKGFGRYGYGLPSAAVSQGRHFEVYSSIDGAQWYKNSLDIDEIGDGKYNDGSGKVIVPESIPAKLPSWLNEYINTAFESDFSHGTIVLLEKLDRLTWVTQAALERNIFEHFGITYRNFLRQVNIYVNGKKVEPTDPLFTTPGFRFYDMNDVHGIALDGVNIEIKDARTHKVEDIIKIRYSYLPPSFTKSNPSDPLSPEKGSRLEIMKEHNGVIVLRQGRQIEVVQPPKDWLTLGNNDRYWKVEVDFPATLDEEFSITTSKQTVRLSDRIWELLKQAGVLKTMKELRARYLKDVDELKAKTEETDHRASERAMQESDKFKTTRPSEPSPEEQARRKEREDEEVRRRAEKTGKTTEEARREFETEVQGHPYRVMREHLPGAPFFRVEQVGGLKVLYLNTAHRFYSKVYWNADATPYFRAAIEVLLFVIGDCELDSSDDRRIFYETERGVWSARLNAALDQLEKFITASKENQPEEQETVSTPTQSTLQL